MLIFHPDVSPFPEPAPKREAPSLPPRPRTPSRGHNPTGDTVDATQDLIQAPAARWAAGADGECR